jgi:cytochrome c nitrite reductase small subunit
MPPARYILHRGADQFPVRNLVQQIGLLPVSVSLLGGLLLGVGVFTFIYGEGASYLSTDPEARVNCHIMQPQFDSWIGSSHTAVAGCVDCHLPHPFIARYVSKADNGFFHSWAFTFQNFHEPIQIKPRNRRIVQENCVACHSDMVHELLPATISGDAVACIHCHADVGHAGARTGGHPTARTGR